MGTKKRKRIPEPEKPARFDQLLDGDMFIHQSGTHFSQVCCDCGSAHNVKLEVISEEEIEVQLYKNRALTKEARQAGGQNGILVSPMIYEPMLVLCRALENLPKKPTKELRKDIRNVARQVLDAQESFELAVKSGDFLS